jgi:hypothetical protein
MRDAIVQNMLQQLGLLDDAIRDGRYLLYFLRLQLELSFITFQKREALHRPGVFPDHRHGNNHHRVRWMPSRPRPLENVNISQHLTTFSGNRCALRRIPGNSEIDPLRDLSEAIKSHHPMAWPERLTSYLRHAPAANVTTLWRGRSTPELLLGQFLDCASPYARVTSRPKRGYLKSCHT